MFIQIFQHWRRSPERLVNESCESTGTCGSLHLWIDILYKADLAEVVQEHNMNIHVFANDTQLYCHRLRDEMSATTVQLERCFAEVSHWMSANRLKLNPDKTELLWAGSKYSH